MAPVGSFFETKSRDSGETFVTLTDSAPDWLKEAIREAHQGDMPRDWIYAECLAACEAIDDGTLTNDDDLFTHADSRVDVYTRDLYQWAADMCLTDTWANAESEANDAGQPDETEKRIACIQYAAIRQIASAMMQAVDENASEESEEASAEG